MSFQYACEMCGSEVALTTEQFAMLPDAKWGKSVRCGTCRPVKARTVVKPTSASGGSVKESEWPEFELVNLVDDQWGRWEEWERP